MTLLFIRINSDVWKPSYLDLGKFVMRSLSLAACKEKPFPHSSHCFYPSFYPFRYFGLPCDSSLVPAVRFMIFFTPFTRLPPKETSLDCPTLLCRNSNEHSCLNNRKREQSHVLERTQSHSKPFTFGNYLFLFVQVSSIPIFLHPSPAPAPFPPCDR